MFRSLSRLFGAGRRSPASNDTAQLALTFEEQPRDAEELLARLGTLGLSRITRCTLTSNRHVMVSFKADVLRVHRGYLAAPDAVLGAIVRFVQGRTKADRRAARAIILAYQVPRPERAKPARRERPHPDDEPLAARLRAAHALLNVERFGGELSAVPVRVSRRMKSRLGHYVPATNDGPAEIAISRRHIKRHGWELALDTLVHEMVHQWQGETGRPVDHGRDFRRKAREVGAAPRATQLILHHA